MDRDIPKQHELLFRGMCSCHQGPLPKQVVDLYWKTRIVADRVGYGLTIGDLTRICVDCGNGIQTPTEEAGPTVAELWKERKVKSGQEVTVEWNGRKRTGKLIRVNADGACIVMMPGIEGERSVKKEQVALTTAA